MTEKETLWLHGFLSGLELTNTPKPYEKSKPTKKQKKQRAKNKAAHKSRRRQGR